MIAHKRHSIFLQYVLYYAATAVFGHENGENGSRYLQMFANLLYSVIVIPDQGNNEGQAPVRWHAPQRFAVAFIYTSILETSSTLRLPFDVVYHSTSQHTRRLNRDFFAAV